MKRGEILDAVKKTITQDRNNRHGEPENSFPRIAQVWNEYLERIGARKRTESGHTLPAILKPSDVAEMMALFKGVRFEIQPDNPDNEHDRIGYFAIAAELREVERLASLEWTEIKGCGVTDGINAAKIGKNSAYRQMENPNAAPVRREVTGRLATCLVYDFHGTFFKHAGVDHKPLQQDGVFPKGSPGDIIDTDRPDHKYWICTMDGGHWTPYCPQASAQ